MGSAMYGGALMRGVGEAGGILSGAMIQGINMQQRWDDQQRNQLALQEARSRDAEELARLKAGLRGSAGGKGGGVLNLSEGPGEELMAAQMGMSVPEYRQFVEMEKTGDDKSYRKSVTQSDGESGQVTSMELPPGFEDFKKAKRAERAKLLETYTFSKDIDKIAKARGSDAETGILEKAAKGDRKAGEALLYSKGKDPMETQARAQERTDKGELWDRTDPNAKKGGSGGGGGGGASANRVQSTKVDGNGNIILVMKDGSIKETGRTASSFNTDIARVVAAMDKSDYKFSKLSEAEKRQRAIERLVGGEGSAAPAAAPAAKQPDMAAAARIKQQFKDGKLSREQATAQLRALGFQ